jgi:hypothetical protein
MDSNETLQEIEEFIHEFQSDPSVTILAKNAISFLNEYAQLTNQNLLFQTIAQSGQSHQPMFVRINQNFSSHFEFF